MKSLRIAALSIAAFLAMGVSAFADSQRITQSTYLYDGPGSNYAVIGTLPADARVEVAGCQNGYCKVSRSWTEGWVLEERLSAGAPAPQPVPQPQPQPQPPQPQPPQPQPQPPQPPQPQFPFPQPQPEPQPWPDEQPWPEPQPPFPDYPQPVPQPVPPPPVYDEAGACFYSERNFGGAVLCLDEGDSYNRLNRWNNRIRSVEIFGGARVDLCTDANFYGSCVTLRQSASRLPFQLDRDVTSLQVY